MGNNDPLYDHKRPESLQQKSKKTAYYRRYAWLLAVFAPLPAFVQEPADPGNLADSFDSATIIIEAEQDACYRFDVYLATAREQQIRGLMHVRRLPGFGDKSMKWRRQGNTLTSSLLLAYPDYLAV